MKLFGKIGYSFDQIVHSVGLVVFVAKARILAPDATCTHHFIHMEALEVKGLSSKFEFKIEDNIKINKFIKARNLNNNIFPLLSNDISRENLQLLFLSEVFWLLK